MKRSQLILAALILSFVVGWILRPPEELPGPTLKHADSLDQTMEEGEWTIRQRLSHRFKAEVRKTTTLGPTLSEEGDRTGYAGWFHRQRAFPKETIPPGARQRALDHAARHNLSQRSDSWEAMDKSVFQGVGRAWTFIGPSTIPNGQTDTGAGAVLSPVSGRIQDLAVDPNTPSTVYAGAAQGGIWKTTNATSATPTWSALTDFEASLATGSLTIDPVNSNIVYVGTGEPAGSCDSYYGAGVLRSGDGGSTWAQLAGNLGGPFARMAISKILLDPNTAGNTSTARLYASTRFGFLSSGTSSCGLAPGSTNTGAVWRSTDAGANWTQLNVPTGVAGSEQIHDMEMDPNNPDIIYVAVRGFNNAANAGVWRTANASAPTPIFTKVATGFINTASANPSTRRITLAIAGSSAAGTLYAAVESLSGSNLWGLYKTLNGGTTWSHVDAGQTGGATITSGSIFVLRTSGPSFSSAMVGQRIIFNNQISRTVTSVDHPSQIRIDSPPPITSAVTWSVGSYPNFCDGQCFYDMSVGVDPFDNDGDVVYVGGNPQTFTNDLNGSPNSHSLWRSDDGGSSWRSVSQGDGISGGLHVDNHAIVFDPSTANRVYSGNDGGLWRSDDQGTSWNGMNTDLGITQFQSVALHPNDSDTVIGGTQDNGTNLLDSALETPPAWFHTDFGDGGQAVIDQNDPSRMFHTYFNAQNFFMGPAKSTNGGTDGPGNWTFVGTYFGYGANYYNGMNPTDPVSFYAPLADNAAYTPSVVYFGSDKVYRSANPLAPAAGVTSWTPVSSAMSGIVSWIESLPVLVTGDEVIYAGTSTGQIQVTTDVNGSTSGCPGACTSTWSVISNGTTPGRFVSDIELDPADTSGNTAYVTFSGFGSSTPGTPGHLFLTTNGLVPFPTWTDISGNLPDTPVSAVALWGSHLYVGTDIGVFESADGGTTWALMTNGHPAVAVFALDRNPSTGQIVSATHGRGMWELDVSIFSDGFESGDTSAWSAAQL